ncbi:hypothetical protein LCGC14_2506660 [marine sediment metagenome]|uniref:Uncharacterized protein n=1 Tax=marine sediment metagenome TaxID=412755 RepID=A0A0F9DC44_9ZZZZ
MAKAPAVHKRIWNHFWHVWSAIRAECRAAIHQTSEGTLDWDDVTCNRCQARRGKR